MRPIPAIVESAQHELAQRIIRKHDSLIECDEQLAAAEQETERLRDTQRRHRVDLGRLLIEAKRGIRHGGWEPFLAKLGIPSQRASEWMRLAEYAASKSPTLVDAGFLPDAPTLAEAGIDRRPRLSVTAEDTSETDDDVSEVPVSLEPDYESNEWYTPSSIIDRAREVLGEIDLDPATCEFAQRAIRATRFFTKSDNGLAHEWHGRIWMNPPYSQPEATFFVEKLIAEYRSGRVTEAVAIQNSSTDTKWFHEIASIGLVCFTRGRVQFDREDGRHTQNRYPTVLFYIGPNGDRFRQVFGELGLVGELRPQITADAGLDERSPPAQTSSSPATYSSEVRT